MTSKQEESLGYIKSISKRMESLERSSHKLVFHTERSIKQMMPIGVIGIILVGMFAIWLSSIRREKWNKKLV
jgi:hypothetical protein